MGGRGRQPGRTAQGDATREALYQAAIRRFAEEGFHGASVRQIARDAGMSAASMYRHFPSKQAVVLELYRRLSRQFEADVDLPMGRWQDRFETALTASLRTLSPHRETLRSVLGELLVGEANLLDAVESRERVRGVFVRVVLGASNRPRVPDAVGRMLYLVHLGVLLLWCVDRSPHQRATRGAQALLLSLPLGVLVRLPGRSSVLARVESIVDEALFHRQ